MDITETDALLVIDVQNDFCPGGALEVPSGGDVVEVINWLMPHFHTVIATQDVHPQDHSSFEEQGGPWPQHCVEGTKGAEFHPGLDTAKFDDIVQKGTDRDTDGYSGFAGTDLADRLHDLDITRVFITGLATDYCVRATALDAIDRGLDVVVVTDAIAAVDAQDGDADKAIGVMHKAGAVLIASAEISS
jgi:nicotinamidase/pyrazinamidase